LSRSRIVVFAVAPSVMLLIVLEAAARFWLGPGFRGWLALPVAITTLAGNTQRIAVDGPLVRPDRDIGYACLPGVHRVSVRSGTRSRSFTATIGQDGLRITSPGEQGADRPEVWILGCSFTWGYLLNDDETFPWIVQQGLPSARVRNFGCNGCGTIQQYLYLKRAAERQRRTPSIAVFVYNPFHLQRNTLSPSVVGEFRSQEASLGDPGYPVVELQRGGDLSVRMVPIFSPEAARIPPQSDARNSELARRIVTGIGKLCSAMRVRPVFAVQSGSLNDELPVFAKGAGFELVDIAVPLTDSSYTFRPLDPHPNARANRVYANRLLEALRRLKLPTGLP
jgi:hypothetical protein